MRYRDRAVFIEQEGPGIEGFAMADRRIISRTLIDVVLLPAGWLAALIHDIIL